MKIVTEADLRTAVAGRTSRQVRIEADERLSQAAMDYVREQGLEVVHVTLEYREMSREKPAPGASAGFSDEAGNYCGKKPEHLTHLRGSVLVPKSHPRIAFRGKMDSLQAKMMEAQVAAAEDGQQAAVQDLAEMLEFARQILGAEVKEIPMEPAVLLGLDDEQLRSVSHNPKKYYGVTHFVTSYEMGKGMVALNALRTAVREAELAAVNAFPDRQRPDLVRALNRLSSAVYILMCRTLSQLRGKGGQSWMNN